MSTLRVKVFVKSANNHNARQRRSCILLCTTLHIKKDRWIFFSPKCNVFIIIYEISLYIFIALLFNKKLFENLCTWYIQLINKQKQIEIIKHSVILQINFSVFAVQEIYQICLFLLSINNQLCVLVKYIHLYDLFIVR